MIVCKEGLIMVHVMRGTTVLNPDTVDASDMTIYCSFAAVGETAENCVIGGNIVIAIIIIVVVIVAVGVCDVGICALLLVWRLKSLLLAIAIVIAIAIVVLLLRLLASCLLRIIFIGDSFVTFGFDMAAPVAIIAY